MEIERVNVTNQVVGYLKKNITEGNWTVGSKIPSENQLTEELSVSRASVRAAIRHFVGIGVLESVHGKGTFIIDDQVDDSASGENKITAEDCKDIEKVLEFRRIVESEACYLAAQNVTPGLVKVLRKYLNLMVIYNKADKEKFVNADLRFHEELCRASANPLLEKSMHKVFEETKRNHRQMNDIFGYQDGIQYHTLILRAVEEGDCVGARDLMYKHMQKAIDDLKR